MTEPTHDKQEQQPMKIWFCKIGEVDRASLPPGSDLPMRQAVAAEYKRLTGEHPDFIFSGWGAELTEPERAAYENRLPEPQSAPPSQVPTADEIWTAAEAVTKVYFEIAEEALGGADAVRKKFREKFYDGMGEVAKTVYERTSSRSSIEPTAPMKLWLWKNFVDGDPQYWAFESPFPTYENGDPITLGSPAGYAIVKPCADGRDGRTDESVVEEIKRALARSTPPSAIGTMPDDALRKLASDVVQEIHRRTPSKYAKPGVDFECCGIWSPCRLPNCAPVEVSNTDGGTNKETK